MSKDKYVILNCPTLMGNRLCYNKEIRQCADCTDCVIKQIVEKCKKYIENYNDKVFYDKDDVKILMGKVMLSQSILSEFLEIQEIE